MKRFSGRKTALIGMGIPALALLLCLAAFPLTENGAAAAADAFTAAIKEQEPGNTWIRTRYLEFNGYRIYWLEGGGANGCLILQRSPLFDRYRICRCVSFSKYPCSLPVSAWTKGYAVRLDGERIWICREGGVVSEGLPLIEVPGG